MSVWWLALNANEGHASYRELKEREVIAQGWPGIGDVGYVRRMRQPHVEDELRRKLVSTYVKFQENLPRKLFTFLCCIEPGDLVVGIEGVKVKGVCRMPHEFSYRYDPKRNYAHALGPVAWVDWEAVSPDWSPKAPAHAVLAVAQMRNDALQVERLARAFRR